MSRARSPSLPTTMGSSIVLSPMRSFAVSPMLAPFHPKSGRIPARYRPCGARSVAPGVRGKTPEPGGTLAREEAAMRESADPGAELRALAAETPVEPSRLARFLDGLAHAERVAAVRSLRRSEQRRLYDGVAGALPLRLADLVLPATADLAPRSEEH